ncbi:MAG TPA: hypothetical protein VF060_27500 [Trebonia sp.]
MRARNSAVQAATGQPVSGEHADAVVAATAVQALLPEGWDALVTSFEEWAGRRPGYGRLIKLIRQDLDNMVLWLDQMAGNRIRLGDPPLAAPRRAGTMSPYGFAAFWLRLRMDEKRLIAAALVLAQVMNLPIWSLPPVLREIANFGDIRLRKEFPTPGHEIPFEEYNYR